MERYALLMAAKYHSEGKRGSGFKVYASPVFSFFKHYMINAGWRDKKAGWQIALAHAKYTFKKYKALKALSKQPGEPTDKV
jgi:hypothetical protein